jgi:hypothetical protein
MEKVFEFKKSYLQFNIRNRLGLGFNISFQDKGVVLIIVVFYIGYHLETI